MSEDPCTLEPAVCSITWCLSAHRWDSDCRPSVEKIPCPEHFNDIDVPPTLVSFAVDVAKEQDIITPELKKAGNKLMMTSRIDKDAV